MTSRESAGSMSNLDAGADTAPQPMRPAMRLLARIFGAVLLVTCLAVIAGAVLPWYTQRSVHSPVCNGATSFTVEETWHPWDVWQASVICGSILIVLFGIFLVPVLALFQDGLRALQGRPPAHERWIGLLCAVTGAISMAVWLFLLVLLTGYTFFVFIHPPCSMIVSSLGSGFYVTLTGYALAFVARGLLPEPPRE
ncbi:MAG TPA: hypothetical protein VGS80_15145 [Ktedonobacterales bacterium]|nr:hypothetical protein [Ktedonobacterales bacterium]